MLQTKINALHNPYLANSSLIFSLEINMARHLHSATVQFTSEAWSIPVRAEVINRFLIISHGKQSPDMSRLAAFLSCYVVVNWLSLGLRLFIAQKAIFFTFFSKRLIKKLMHRLITNKNNCWFQPQFFCCNVNKFTRSKIMSINYLKRDFKSKTIGWRIFYAAFLIRKTSFL